MLAFFRRRRRSAYDEGYRAAQTDLRAHYTPIVEEYERLLGEARSGLTTKETERLDAVHRGDALTDKLLALAGVRGVTATSRATAQLERDTSRSFLRSQDEDAFTEVAPGPDCTYTTAAAALIDPLACEPEETSH